MALNLDNGDDIVLGVLLAKAGEGTIHEVPGHPDWVAKIFHPTLTGLDLKLDKVAAMVTAPPPDAVQPDGFVVVTWPLHVILEDDRAVGYVMRRIDTANAVEIHNLSNPSNRANPLPSAPQWLSKATWLHLVNVAANLCLAVETVHRVGAVIGDFQERNILVADTTRVTLVDSDSMQFSDAEGRQFLCGVGRPEFTAPELAAVSLRTTPRDVASDLFALAVHIHVLLMAGNHPFLRGSWTGVGEQPDALSLARDGYWAGGWQSPLHTHPLAPPPSFLPNDIQQLFLRALTTGAHDPALRPSAAEWRTALGRVAVTDCTAGEHQIPLGCTACPWCQIDIQRQMRRTSRQAVERTAAASSLEPPLSSARAESPQVSRSRPLSPRLQPKVARKTKTRRRVVFALLTLLVVTGTLIVVVKRDALFAPDPVVVRVYANTGPDSVVDVNPTIELLAQNGWDTTSGGDVKVVGIGSTSVFYTFDGNEHTVAKEVGQLLEAPILLRTGEVVGLPEGVIVLVSDEEPTEP